MKTSYFPILLVTALLSLASCKNGGIFKKDLSGVYIGEAQIFIEQRQFWPDSSPVDIILIDTTITDTITVSAIDKGSSTYSIERASHYFGSFYDFEGETTLDDNHQWSITYTYDRDWLTQIGFEPKDDAFEATMLVRDVFESFEEDSLGQHIYYYVVNREYRVKAFR